VAHNIALMTASVLYRYFPERIKNIWVFGSAAQPNSLTCRDVDLIISTSPILAETFRKKVLLMESEGRNASSEGIYSLCQERYDTVFSVLLTTEFTWWQWYEYRAWKHGFKRDPVPSWSSQKPYTYDDFEQDRQKFGAALEKIEGLLPHPKFLDLFIFPDDWQMRPQDIQATYDPHGSDPDFVENAAKAARRYDPIANRFLDPSAG
jgi:hypothetical protein